MTYFPPGPGPRPGEEEGGEPRRIGSQPARDPRSSSRQPAAAGRPQPDELAAAVPVPPAETYVPPSETPVPPSEASAPPADLADLFPAREVERPEQTRSVIDLTRHEQIIAASAEPARREFERPVPPGFPVELPQPSVRREQLLMIAVSWLIVLFTTLLGALGGLTYASVKTPSYTATASVLVYSPVNTTSTQSSAADFANSYARVATQTTVLQPALVDAGLSMSADQARKQLDVSAPAGAAIILVRARANNGADSAALANAAANGIVSYASARRAQTGYRVTNFTPATAPTSGSRPHRLSSVLIGSLIGLAVGASTVLLIRRSRRMSAPPAA